MSRNTVNWRHKKSVADRLNTSAAAVEVDCTIHTVQAAVWMAITFLLSEIQFTEKEKYGFRDQEIYVSISEKYR